MNRKIIYVLYAPQICTQYNDLESALKFRRQLTQEGIQKEEIKIKKRKIRSNAP